MSTCVQNCFALVLQNSSVLSVIPTKRHGEIYREKFPGQCRPRCACFSFLSKSKGGSLAFYSRHSLLTCSIPASHREPGSSVQAWVADRGNCMQETHQQTRGRATVKDTLGLAGLSLSCNLPVRLLDLPGFCSAALILIPVYSVGMMLELSHVLNRRVWALKVSGEA